MQNILPIVFWVAIFALFWFLFIRPQKKRQQEHQRMIQSLKVGDQIVTIGGIKGTITGITDEDFKIRISSGVEIRMIKNSIGRKITKDEDEDKAKDKKEKEE